MHAFVVGDNQATASKLRDLLVERGVECPLTNVLSLDGASAALPLTEPGPWLVLLGFSPDWERSLAVLQQLRNRTEAMIVAVGPARDPQQILNVVHAGPDDYLDEQGDLERELDTLLDRVRSSGRGQGAPGQLLTVMSASGGSGCSMLATNLAAALAQEHGRCGLLDLNLQRGDLAALLNLKVRHTITDLCRNLQKLDQDIFEESLLKHECGVSLLAAPQTIADALQVSSEAAEQITQFARRTFPSVVVDLEDFFHREQFRLLQLSEQILFALRLDFGALRNARRALDYLEGAGVDVGKIRIVVNQFGRPKELAPPQAEEVLGMAIAHYVPDDPKRVVSSLNRGVPAFLDAPRCRLSRAIAQIADEISAGVAV